MKPRISFHWRQFMVGIDTDYIGLVAVYLGPIQIVW